MCGRCPFTLCSECRFLSIRLVVTVLAVSGIQSEILYLSVPPHFSSQHSHGPYPNALTPSRNPDVPRSLSYPSSHPPMDLPTPGMNPPMPHPPPSLPSMAAAGFRRPMPQGFPGMVSHHCSALQRLQWFFGWVESSVAVECMGLMPWGEVQLGARRSWGPTGRGWCNFELGPALLRVLSQHRALIRQLVAQLGSSILRNAALLHV